MADPNKPLAINSDAEAREFVKNGGHPNDTTPRRQAEIAAHAVNNETLKEVAKDPSLAHPHHSRFRPPLGHSSNPIKGPAPATLDGPRVNYTVPAKRAENEPQIGTKANPFVAAPVGSSPGVENPGNISGFRGPRNMPYITEEAEAEHRTRTNERGGGAPVAQTKANGRLVGPDGTVQPVNPAENQSDIDAARAMLAAPAEEQRAKDAQSPTTGAGPSSTPQGGGGNATADTATGSTGATGNTAGATDSTSTTGATAAPAASAPVGSTAATGTTRANGS